MLRGVAASYKSAVVRRRIGEMKCRAPEQLHNGSLSSLTDTSISVLQVCDQGGNKAAKGQTFRVVHLSHELDVRVTQVRNALTLTTHCIDASFARALFPFMAFSRIKASTSAWESGHRSASMDEAALRWLSRASPSLSRRMGRSLDSCDVITAV